MKRIIGIDLGTTNSAAAFLENGEAKIIPNDRGNRITPSIVSVLNDGDLMVGEAAKNQAVVHANNTVVSVKRHMGSSKTFNINKTDYTPEQISAYILGKLKQDAENYLGEELPAAVITVPAYFSEKQRRATVEAGKLAGFTVKRIINEPTAAALAYAYEVAENSNILVYDLGGGTFDVTYLVKEGRNFSVKATCGDNNLGGVDFDELLLKKVLRDFSEKAGIDLEKDKIIMQQLREHVERAKIELSSRSSAHVAMPFIAGSGGPVHVSCTITRGDFEALIQDRIEKTVELALQTVRDAGAKPSDVGSLILAGGSSRIPLVKNLLAGAFHIEAEKKINPEEVVALGAAIQASILAGEADEIALQDITPFSLGLEIEGGRFHRILDKNTPIPTRACKVFTTVSDNQSSVEIHVLQGEEMESSGNTSLGRFLLSGIRTGKRGDPRIRVNFDIDADGILHVRARDIDTKSEQRVSMTAGFGSGGEDDSDVGFAELKNRTESLISRIEGLLFRGQRSIDRNFQREINDVIKKTNDALYKKERQKLLELKIELETIIGELTAIAHIEEELTG